MVLLSLFLHVCAGVVGVFLLSLFTEADSGKSAILDLFLDVFLFVQVANHTSAVEHSHSDRVFNCNSLVLPQSLSRSCLDLPFRSML